MDNMIWNTDKKGEKRENVITGCENEALSLSQADIIGGETILCSFQLCAPS